MPQTKTTLKEMLVQQQAEHAQQGMQYQESRVQNRNYDFVVPYFQPGLFLRK